MIPQEFCLHCIRWACLVVIAYAFPLLGDCCAEQIDFARDIRPIFVEHCYACHSEGEQQSGLRLDLKSAAIRGGDNHGPDIVPRNAEESPLLTFVRSTDPDKRMPPDYALDAEQIEKLTRSCLARWN
jgi:hypothetical protein